MQGTGWWWGEGRWRWASRVRTRVAAPGESGPVWLKLGGQLGGRLGGAAGDEGRQTSRCATTAAGRRGEGGEGEWQRGRGVGWEGGWCWRGRYLSGVRAARSRVACLPRSGGGRALIGSRALCAPATTGVPRLPACLFGPHPLFSRHSPRLRALSPATLSRPARPRHPVRPPVA